MHFDFGSALISVVTLTIYALTNRREIKKRHEENMMKWNDLLTELCDFPPHEHMEAGGPLTAAGVRMRRFRREEGYRGASS